MKTLTELMLSAPQPFGCSPDDMLHFGAQRDQHDLRRLCRQRWESVRATYGLAPKAPMLTRGDHNVKLNKAAKWTVGLTLQHYVQKLSTGLTLNACPNAGHCTKVCVLDNGNGMFPKVQVARRAKTEFFALHPLQACFLLGWELADEVERHGSILFRPNVNSDVEWEKVLPSLTSGAVFGEALWSYGYTKLPGVLVTDGYLDAAYRVAYSWNETSDPVAVGLFLNAGGSVAVVTDRKKGEFEHRPFHLPGHPYNYFVNWYRHVDADLTDEWIFKEGAVGNLSAKGKARSLIGKSNFIVQGVTT
jgi:hypothetical protein